jgi:subtilase family serine protease
MGEAPSSLHLGALELELAKTPAQTQALERLLAAQHDPKSAQYHHWLTPAEYGARFGVSNATIATLSQWLEANGLRVAPVPPSRSRLHFQGSKAQVEATFHTQIHLYTVNRVEHFANVDAPEVPAEFAPLITAIRGLHDFYPTSGASMRHAKPATPDAQPQVGYGAQGNYVAPGDFAVMYNLLPLYRAGADGSGVTIAVAGQSDIALSTASAFWTGFGLATSHFQSVPVPVADGGQDPGQTNDQNEGEAYLDVEIAGGLAQGASILLVRDKDALAAAEYVIEQNLGAVLNLSFSACESSLGAANAALSMLFQQAASQGITVSVSAGDAGVAGCATEFTQGQLSASGFAVNGIASTPYALAVGGTDLIPASRRTGPAAMHPAAWRTPERTFLRWPGTTPAPIRSVPSCSVSPAPRYFATRRLSLSGARVCQTRSSRLQAAAVG